ncbi:MAG: pitrilysin family protein, partial [Chthoniobacteraceae bacterium]
IARDSAERARLVKALSLFTLIAFSAAHAEIVTPPLAFTDRTLANGLRVIALEDHSTPTAAIHLWYRVGSKDDPAGRSGFAHLFEHMMFKSTKRMPNETLDRLTEDVGGENNAFTSDDVTAYHETVPANHLERLIWAEAERLSSLRVDTKNFFTERDVVKEEFRQSVLAKPYGEFGEWIPKMSFAEHPYKRPTIGNIEELEASNLDEVKSFHAIFYRPDNAVLVVVGDFEPADLQGWVDQYFGPIPKPETPIPRVTVKEPPRTGERTLRDSSPKIPLPTLAVTYLGPAVTSDEAPALNVLQQALSGGESSRLYRVLIYEKELAQSAEFVADLRADLGLLTFQLILASGVDIGKARAALLDEVKKLIDAPVSETELTTAKNQFLASQLASRETCDGKASALAEAAAIRGDPALVNSDLARLQSVTAEQVQASAIKWFTDDNRLVLEYLPATAATRGKEKK